MYAGAGDALRGEQARIYERPVYASLSLSLIFFRSSARFRAAGRARLSK